MTQTNNTDKPLVQEQEFLNVQDIIYRHRSKALREVNNENVISAWEVGCFISARLKTAAWGSKTVTQLAEFLRRNDPTLRGFSRRMLYNMVDFFDCYTSPEFESYMQRWPHLDKVQDSTGQIVQPLVAQLQHIETQPEVIVQPLVAQFRPIPKFLLDISFTNHIIICNNCKRMDAKIFYILYACRERLSKRALQRALTPKETVQRSLDEFVGFIDKSKK